MSVPAPTTFTVTGGASVTITLGAAWATTGGPAQVALNILATTFTLNSNPHKLADFYDNASGLVADLAAAASVSTQIAEQLFRQLQAIVSMYMIQALQSFSVPFSIALA